MVAFCSYGTDFVQMLDAADRILASFLQHCILLCVFVNFYIFFQIQIQKPCTRHYIGRKSYCTHYSLQWRFTASYQPESRVPPLVKEASSHIPPFILLTSLCMYSAHVVRGRPTARLPPGCRGVTVPGSNTAWCKREECSPP